MRGVAVLVLLGIFATIGAEHHADPLSDKVGHFTLLVFYMRL